MSDRTTATAMSESHADEMRVRNLHKQVEWFHKKWMPEDRAEAAEWGADLHMVIVAMHREAAMPMQKALESAFATMPFKSPEPKIMGKAQDAQTEAK